MAKAWLVALMVVVGACSASDDPGAVGSPVTTIPLQTSATTDPVVETSTPPDGIRIPPQLIDLDIVTVTLDGRELLVAVADDFTTRERGLMFVEDLRSLDGMLFVWDDYTNSSFWMENTLIPLDIAWFDANGQYVSDLTMEVCEPDESCRNYYAAAIYLYALEVPAGEMPALDTGSRLDVGF